MKIEFAKDKSNIDKHGISLNKAAKIEMLAVLRDERIDYGEERFRAWGLIEGVAHCLAFATRDNKVRRLA